MNRERAPTPGLAMIVTCPSCATRYEVPGAALSGAARRLRCKACLYEWQSGPEEADSVIGAGPPPLPAEAPDLARHLEDAARLERNLAALAARGPMRDIESAPRSAGPSRGRGRLGSAQAARLVALAASLALVIIGGWEYREAIVRAAPQMAALYGAAGIEVNVRGMDFANVAVERKFEDGLPVLSVSGDIVNVSERSLEIPRVRFGLRDAAAQEIYHWTMAVDAGRLPPGERTAFVTRLAAPPQEARQVVVRFHDVSPRQAALAD